MDNLCVGRVVLSVKNKFGGEPPVCLMPMEEFLSRLKFSPSSDCFLKVADLSTNSLRQLAIEYLTSALTRLNSSFSSNLIVERLAVVQLDSSNDGSNLDCANANRKETTMGKYNSGENPLVDSLEPVDVKPDLSVDMSEVAPTGDENCDKKQINLDGLDLPSSKDEGNFCGVFSPYPLGVVKNMASTCRPTEPGNRGEHLLVESMETQNGGMQGEQITSGHMPQPIGRLAGEKGKTVIICPRTGCQSTAGDRLSASVQSDIDEQHIDESGDEINFETLFETTAKERFHQPSEETLRTISNCRLERTTLQQTKWGVKVFKDWLRDTGILEDFEALDDTRLNLLLRQFYAGARTQRGETYSRSALIGIRSAINRHLTSEPFVRKINLSLDRDFMTSNQVLYGIIKEQRRTGRGVAAHHEAISDEDLRTLFASGTLSDKNPTSLLRKVWFEMALYLGVGGRDILRGLTMSSFVFQTDDLGRDYVQMVNKESDKNHKVKSVVPKEDHKNLRMYASGVAGSCPVASLKLYLKKRNPRNPAFFQRPITSPSVHSCCWYGDKALGYKKLGNMMAEISADAGLSRRYTNLCVRTTTATFVPDASVSVKDVMSRVAGKHRISGAMLQNQAESSA